MKPKLLKIITISPFNNSNTTIQLQKAECPREKDKQVSLEKNCRQCLHYSTRLAKDYCSQTDK